MEDIIEGAKTFKALWDTLKPLINLGEAAKDQGVPSDFAEELNAKIVEMRSVVTEAQTHTIEANERIQKRDKRIQELEAKIAEYDDWEVEKKRYELVRLKLQGLVYSLRKECKRGSEPDHYICAVCYQDRRKSILQVQPNPEHNPMKTLSQIHIPMYFLACSRCGEKIQLALSTRKSSRSKASGK